MKELKGKKKVTEIKTFIVPFSLGDIEENFTINTNSPSKLSKEQIIVQAFKFHSQGNILEAVKYYQYLINQGFKDHRVFSNYGIILKGFGKLKEAELYYRKAIEIKPDFPNAYYNLGIILKGLGKLKEAAGSFRKAIKIKANDPEAHYNLGGILRDLGNFKDAELSTRKAIKIKPEYAEAYYNLGIILRDLCNLKDAELSTRKAIKIKPDYSQAYYHLGTILQNIGNLQEAELSIHKAIKYNPDCTEAYYILSKFNYSNDNKKWKYNLFSEQILNNKSREEEINIYFARANILHNEKKYIESARYLKLANDLKLELKPSKPNDRIHKSKLLLEESDKTEINNKKYKDFPESIFIVGMFRSGSTLLESILSTRNDVHDLGEINILEESFFEYKKNNQGLTIAELYWKEASNKTGLKITTNKWLYNYQYVGVIASKIPNAKIIHCYRNPLDNILSIYRAHFATGNEYSSSLVDCAKVYLDQEETMTEYKNRYRSKIYDLNYDFLVSNSNKEIKSLISWLGWKWDDSYLTPHLNSRSVSTASSVEVRSPINSKSIGGWKNYKEMLKPAIEILAQTDKYQAIIS